MKWYTYSGEGRPALRGGGNPWIQWTALVWIALALNEYWNGAIGFRPLSSYFKWGWP